MNNIFLKILAVIIIIVAILYIIPVKKANFNYYYKNQDSILSSLLKFRKIPLKSINYDGYTWNYLVTGKGTQTILFLHGMGGAYDIWWQQINYLKNDFKIISLSYPPVNSLKKMGDAAIKILDKEGINQFNIVGSSLGGYFAQYLANTYPEKIKRAVFANTFPENDDIKNENHNKEWMFKLAPEWLIMNILRKGFKKAAVPASNNSKIVEAYLLEQYSGLMSKKQFIARYNCVTDKFKHTNISKIPILIIESDNDPYVSEKLRQKLKKEYPKAIVKTLHQAGHFPYLSKAPEYNKILSQFLKNNNQK